MCIKINSKQSSIKMNRFNLLVNLKTLNMKSNSINRLENNSFNI